MSVSVSHESLSEPAGPLAVARPVVVVVSSVASSPRPHAGRRRRRSPVAMSAGELVAAWRLHLVAERHLRPTTVRVSVIIVRRWLQHLADRRRPWELATTRDLHRFLTHRPLAGRTQRLYATYICDLYRWAEEQGWTDGYRMAGWRHPRAGDPPPRSMNLDDVHDLLATAAAVDPRLEVIFALAYWAGLRAGEIARLRIEDLELSGPEPSMIVHGKGGHIDRVALHPALCGILTRWLAGRPRSGPVITSHAYGRTGAPISPTTVSVLASKAMREQGLRASLHALRHTFATEMLRHGVPIDAVSAAMRHRSLATTQRYVNRLRDARARAAVLTLPDPRHSTQPADEKGGPPYTADVVSL